MIPQIFEPTLTAYLTAFTRLGLIFFSKFPPPTEKIKIKSFLLSLLVFNHSEKIVSQPSSFVLAVSSDTLSVGA